MEYKIIDWEDGCTTSRMEVELNKLALEGWRIISTMNDDFGSHIFLGRTLEGI